MNDYPRRILIAYAAFVGLLLLFAFLPIALGWQMLGAVLIFVIVGHLYWRINRYRKVITSSTANIAFLSQKLDLLPARQRYRLPILLVTGNSAKDFFPQDLSLAESNVLISSEAVWIYVEEYTHLPIVFDSLVSRWPDMSGRIGIYLALTPEQEDKQGLFVAKLQAFRQAWADTCRLAKYQLPVYLSTHIGLNDLIYNDDKSVPVNWFQMINHQLYLLDSYSSPLDNWVNDYKTTSLEREKRLRLHPFLIEIKDWVENNVITVLNDPKQPIAKCNPIASVIYPLNNHSVPNNLIQNIWQRITTLTLPNTKKLEFVITPPDQLIKVMPVAYPISPMRKLVSGFIIITSLFVLGCMGASFWNNIKLAEQIRQDIERYNLVDNESYDEKFQTLTLLKEDRNRLSNYFKEGEPLNLSFGLYRGQQLLLPLNQAIGRYVPPPPPPEPPAPPEKIIIKEKEIVIKEPEVIRLDSLSLFESGKATLKPESTKVLINALMEIKTKIKANNDTGWLVLITGHTDSVGDANKNQQLSLDRATAVRDWVIKTSDIPETCFAIQGYGAKQPLVGNETPEDRAKNRRVEISLVPQISTCKMIDEN
ncbi:OmpA family protein [Orbaceae bacterium ac157xtp]